MRTVLIMMCLVLLCGCEEEDPHTLFLDYASEDDPYLIDVNFVEEPRTATIVIYDAESLPVGSNLILWIQPDLETEKGYDPNCIRELAESGQICEVMGHQWGDSFIPMDPNAMVGYRCRLCGHTKLQKWSEWTIE